MLAALLLGNITVAQAQLGNSARPGMADLLEQVTPAVVNIAVKGHILTNHHVVDKASEITVILRDNQQLFLILR